METQLRWSSYRINKKNIFIGQRTSKSSCYALNYQEGLALHLNAKIYSGGSKQWRPLVTKAKRTEPMKDGTLSQTDQKKGSIGGAVALIIGTSIGSGILALPKKTASAGFIPSATSIVLCWGFLLVEALLLSELNVRLRKRSRKNKREDENKLEIISITTMAQETLGQWGGALATLSYIFLAYTSMVAYTSKSGEILSHLINLPTSLSGIIFTISFTILVFLGGTHLIDQINQWLTASMLGLLVGIEVIGAVSGGWSELVARADWASVPATVSVIIFSLVYHDLAPVICSYLDGDMQRIRVAVVLGSLVPLIALLVWDAEALSQSTLADGVDPLDFLLRGKGSEASTVVVAFSLLAVGTSLLGTILGFSKFLLEQLTNLKSQSRPTQGADEFHRLSELKIVRKESALECLHGNTSASDSIVLETWWDDNKISFTAMVMVVAPPLLVSSSLPDAFATATDIAGGYCMAILYGILPPAMAWTVYGKSLHNDDQGDKEMLSKAKPALVGAGLFACGVVVEQMLQDFSFLHL